ncbi:MAG: argininosuccinate lyase, partial [Candidatus Verstraetearchaeota archaeon]|nr:argininosuccinate lyase [Candidatus Verstraetearchaeota archaeon]
ELVKKAINPEYNVNIRKTIGGPSIEENERMINKGMEILEKNKDIVNNLEKKIKEAKEKMMILINSL